MGVFDKLGKGLGMSSKELDVEEYMNAAEMENVDVMHEPADHYIKPVSLQQQSDLDLIKRELTEGNIILMNIAEMSKRPNTLKGLVEDLRGFVEKQNGDIARIDNEKIILTPGKTGKSHCKIAIIKTRRAPQK